MSSQRITFVAKSSLAEKIEDRAEELCLNKSEFVRRAVAEEISDV
jgi:hypothetical protein